MTQATAGETLDGTKETAETPPDDAKPIDKSQLTRIFVSQQGEQGDAMTTRVLVELVFAAPRLNPLGEITSLIQRRSQSELEATAEFVEYERIRGRFADTESQRLTAAKRLSKCEADLPAIIRRGDDPSECERELVQSRSEVATLTDRIRILREAEAEAHRACSITATSIVRSASIGFREEAGAARTAAFAEFVKCQQFVDLCRAHDRQREAFAVDERHIADVIVPSVSNSAQRTTSSVENGTHPAFGATLYQPQDPEDVRRREAAIQDAQTQATKRLLKQSLGASDDYNRVITEQQGT